ncbi:hypothetical protein HY78_00465 [Rhizorhabdus wittichii DC-6]|nr:hypothetical protein HY78_00465 [Rhizorhabdus wittichii DC-6]
MKMGFKAKHGVNHNGTLYGEGATVKFTAEELAEYEADETGPIADLLERNAIERFSPIVEKARDVLEKPLAEMTEAEIAKLAQELGIPPLDEATMLVEIETRRSEIAAQADQAGKTGKAAKAGKAA